MLNKSIISSSEIPSKLAEIAKNQAVAVSNWQIISQALNDAGIMDDCNHAVVCATVAVETGSTFEPLEEQGSQDYFISHYWNNLAVRKALGNTMPQDAIDYHGRGYIQLTGRSNYEALGRCLNAFLMSQPELLCQPEIAAKALVWFWKSKNLPQLCLELGTDNRGMYGAILQGIRRKVNGGLNGFDEFTRVMGILGC